MGVPEGGERVRRQLLRQAGWCDELGSPLSARLLRTAAVDLAGGGPAWRVLEPYGGEPDGAAVPLRFLAAVHRLVLQRRAPALALHYPSVGGTAGAEGAEAPFLATVDANAEELRGLVARPLQTNEVGRCAALLGGFLAVARETGLPLRLLELGSSAGLNLRWDRYRYAQPDRGWAWGAPGAGLALDGLWSRPPRPEPPSVTVTERRGCDPAPVDATTAEGRLTLTSAVWPDQAARFERLRAALAVAARVPARVDAENAATWLPARLAEPAGGVATVVFQSVVDQYLQPEDRAAVRAALEAADGVRPLAWLRLEPDPGSSTFGIDLRTWGWEGQDRDRRVGTSGAHGTGVAVEGWAA